jgi:hypothetical protein
VKLLIAAALVLMLSAAALAVPDSKQVGPYTVSFDMNAQYLPQIGEPMETEAANAYSIRLFQDNSTFSIIGITEYAQPTDATLRVHEKLMAMSMALYEGLNVTAMDEKSIDGKNGFIFTSEPFQDVPDAPSAVYKALYWLDSQDCECGPVSVGTTSVTITSTYPLDVTNGLLSSLHIEKGMAATQPEAQPQTGGQILPPA